MTSEDRPPASIYDSERLAAGYAFCRPPVHEDIVRAIGERLRRSGAITHSALDVGCGAGRSTAALGLLASRVVGLEPVAVMLRHSRTVAPRARFVVGRAEELPFADGSFDLLAAAGSLNYADLGLFLTAASRVLTAGGVLVIYDFSAGRRLAGDPALDEWFRTFEQRYPFAPGYELDVRLLPFESAGLRLDGYEALEVQVSMTLSSYLPYVLSETNVELAISTGGDEEEIREWCGRTLHPIFGDASREVLFDAYVAYARKV